MNEILQRHFKKGKNGQFIIYPNFHDIIKCDKDFKVFKNGKEYQIVGFGNSNDNEGVKHKTWWIKSLYDKGVQFPVKKETINKLFDREILINIID